MGTQAAAVNKTGSLFVFSSLSPAMLDDPARTVCSPDCVALKAQGHDLLMVHMRCLAVGASRTPGAK